jgi:hypothetical protein
VAIDAVLLFRLPIGSLQRIFVDAVRRTADETPGVSMRYGMRAEVEKKFDLRLRV